MKKTVLVASVTAALLAALAGASAYGAWRVHQQLNRIHNALPDYPILKPVTRSKTYSLLQSEERVSYQLGCDNLFSSEMFGGQRPSLTLRHVVSHNPLKPGVHTEIVWSPQWQEKLKTLYGEQPPLAIDTRLRWNGDVETTLHSPGVKVDRDSRHVNWQGLTLVLQYDQALTRLHSRLTLPGLALADDAQRWQIELQASEYSSQLVRSPSGLLLGKDSWRTSGLTLQQGSGTSAQGFSSGPLQASHDSREQSGMVETSGKFSWVGLHLNNKPLGDLSSSGNLSRLNAAALAESQRQTLHKGLLQCQLNNDLLHPDQRALLIKLLAGNPALAVAVTLATPDGAANLQLDAALKGVTEADLAQEKLQALQDKISLQARLSWPQALPERWVNDFAPEHQRDALVQQYRLSVAPLLQSGHLRQNGNRLETRFDLVGGKLLQNGLPMAGLSPLSPPPAAAAAAPEASAPAFEETSGAPQ